MKRLALFFLALALLMQLAIAQLTPQQIYTESEGSVVYVMSVVDGTMYHGTGFVVYHNGRHVVLTARHLIGDAKGKFNHYSALWLTYQGQSMQDFTVKTSEKFDMIELIPKRDVFKSFLHLRSYLPVIGDTAYTLAFPQEMPLTLGKLMVSTFIEDADAITPGNTMCLTGTSSPGVSGGPILDEFGSVIGMSNEICVKYPTYGYALSSTVILKELDKLDP